MSLISGLALFVMLLSAVPQWVVLGGSLKTFHLGGALLAGCVLANPRTYGIARFALQANFLVIAGFTAFLLLAVTLLGYHRFPYYSALDLGKQMFLLVTGLAICLAIATMEARHLRWACLAVGVLLPTLFALLVVYSVTSRGLTLAKLGALFVGQPLNFVRAILLELFSTSLAGVVGAGLEEALANMRHGIMNTIMLGMFLMLSYPKAPAGNWVEPLLKLGATAFASAMVVVSFSRSDTIELAAAMLVAAGLVTVVRGINPLMILGACSAVLLVGAVALSDVGTALVERFTDDTGSYDAREEAIGDSIAALDKGFWFGIEWRPEVTGQISAHNMILNAGQGTGIFGMAAMATFVLAIVVGGARLAGRAARAKTLDLAGADLRWVIALAIIPAVRSMTAGGGLAIAEWSALGAFMGFRTRAALAEHAARVAAVPAFAARGRLVAAGTPASGIAARWAGSRAVAGPAGMAPPAAPPRPIAARFTAPPVADLAGAPP